MNPENFFACYSKLELALIEKISPRPRTPILLITLPPSDFPQISEYFILSITFLEKSDCMIYVEDDWCKKFSAVKIDVMKKLTRIDTDAKIALFEISEHSQFYGKVAEIPDDMSGVNGAFEISSDENGDFSRQNIDMIYFCYGPLAIAECKLYNPDNFMKLRLPEFQRVTVKPNSKLIVGYNNIEYPVKNESVIQWYPNYKSFKYDVPTKFVITYGPLIRGIGINGLKNFHSITLIYEENIVAKILPTTLQLYKNLVDTHDEIIIPFSSTMQNFVPNFSILAGGIGLTIDIKTDQVQTVEIKLYAINILRYINCLNWPAYSE